MSESIPPLDPELLEPLRSAEPAPPEVRARVRERLLTAVAGGVAGGAGTSGRAAGRFRSPGTPGTTLVAFLVGGVAGAGLYAALLRPPAPRVVYVDRPVPQTAATLEVPSAPVPTPAPAATEQAPAIAPVASSLGTPGRAHPSQLSAERVLLDQARAALAQGDPAAAMERLDHHRRIFPAPLLAEERDAMWIEALVKAHRYDEARSRAEIFRRRSPDSLFSSVVDSAIESIP
jgi:hypothetical protein